jgi:hypothetical protein
MRQARFLLLVRSVGQCSLSPLPLGILVVTESMPQRGFQKRSLRILVVMIIKQKKGECAGDISILFKVAYL